LNNTSIINRIPNHKWEFEIWHVISGEFRT